MRPASSCIKAKEKFLELCRQGKYREGERLPAEMHMAQLLGVSRDTWRKSLESLRQEGIVRSKHGVGTFVVNPSGARETDLTQLCTVRKMIEHSGVQEGHSSYDTGIMMPNKRIASALNLQSQDRRFNVFFVHCMKYTADGQPLCYSENYIPSDLADELKTTHMPDNLLSYLKQDKNIQIERSIAHIMVPQYRDSIAAQLRGEDEKLTVLCIEQTYFDKNEIPVLYTVDYLRSDIFRFVVTRR